MRTKLGAILSVSVTLTLLTTGLYAALSPGLAAAGVNPVGGGHTTAAPAGGEGGGTLEAVASKAGETGRRVAMSLIGLAFAVAGVLLAFRRDFREAVGVFAVGIVAVLLVTPAGLSLVQDTVTTLLGGQ